MKGKRMKKTASSSLGEKQRAELKALAKLPDDKIDTRDMPETRDWSKAKRGVFYRPMKQQLTLRIDADVVAWFKDHTAKSEGYQTNINRALREHVERRERGRKRG
jgi:uncharacterized protein (DUF4415 family)